MVFAAGTCSFGVVLQWGICTLFLSATVGYSMNVRPHRGAFAAFPSGGGGGGGVDTLGIDSAIIKTRQKCASVSPITGVTDNLLENIETVW